MVFNFPNPAGNIGPPVPPRSQVSLGNEENIYVVPNKASFKRPCKLWDVLFIIVIPYDLQLEGFCYSLCVFVYKYVQLVYHEYDTVVRFLFMFGCENCSGSLDHMNMFL